MNKQKNMEKKTIQKFFREENFFFWSTSVEFLLQKTIIVPIFIAR